VTAAVLPDQTTPFGERVHRRLRDDPIIWFTCVGEDGTPQPNPVWFVWEEDHVLIYNRRGARRVDYLRRRPRVSLHFDSDGRGGDIIVLSGQAEVVDQAPPPHQMPTYLGKYEQGMVRVSGSPEGFARAYPTAVRVRVTHVRGF
jgi:PPOX class probable F420-dependent enzyme